MPAQPPTPPLGPHRDLAIALALSAFANTLAAGFTIFHLLGTVLTVAGAVVFVAVEMAGALLCAVVLGRTSLGARSTRQLVMIGQISLLLFYLSLLLAASRPAIGIALAGLAFGGYVMLFYVPFNAAMLQLTRRDNRSVVMGSYSLMFTLVATMVPLVGGTLIDQLSFEFAVGAAAAIVATNVVFLRLVARLPPIAPIVLHGDLHRLLPGRTSLGLWAEGLFEGAVWAGQPILAFSYLSSASGYGGLIAVLSICGAAATVALGRRSDRGGTRRRYLLAGMAVLATGAIVGLAQRDLLMLTVALGLVVFASHLVSTFLFAQAGDHEQPSSALALWREVLLNCGRLCGVGLLLLGLWQGILHLAIFAAVLVAVPLLGVAAGAPPPQVAAATSRHGVG